MKRPQRTSAWDQGRYSVTMAATLGAPERSLAGAGAGEPPLGQRAPPARRAERTKNERRAMDFRPTVPHGEPSKDRDGRNCCMFLKPHKINVRFVGVQGSYQSIETQAVRIHKSLERWGGEAVKSHLSLLPQDFFKRHGLFRQAPLKEMQGLIEGMQIIIVVKSSLFRGFL